MKWNKLFLSKANGDAATWLGSSLVLSTAPAPREACDVWVLASSRKCCACSWALLVSSVVLMWGERSGGSARLIKPLRASWTDEQRQRRSARSQSLISHAAVRALAHATPATAAHSAAAPTCCKSHKHSDSHWRRLQRSGLWMEEKHTNKNYNNKKAYRLTQVKQEVTGNGAQMVQKFLSAHKQEEALPVVCWSFINVNNLIYKRSVSDDVLCW